jgi:hypothetical protein
METLELSGWWVQCPHGQQKRAFKIMKAVILLITLKGSIDSENRVIDV